MYVIHPGNVRSYFVSSNKYSIIKERKRGRRITIFKASFICLHCYCESGIWLLFLVFCVFFNLVTVPLVFVVSEIM